LGGKATHVISIAKRVGDRTLVPAAPSSADTVPSGTLGGILDLL